MFMFSLVSISRYFFKGAIARNGAIVIVLVFLIAKRIVVTAEMLLPSFLGNDGSPFLDSGFSQGYVLLPTDRPTDAAVTQIDRYFQNQIRFGAVCWS